ncbi:MAG: hypothetical protein IPH36_10125 [Saprospiraceae bacterium]|nr:hypothetical protein [Saprospiraceae bacterium]
MLAISGLRFWKTIQSVVWGCALMVASLIIIKLLTGTLPASTALLIKVMVSLLAGYVVVVKMTCLPLLDGVKVA